MAMDSQLGAEAFPDSYPELCRYVDILAKQGIDWGLLGPKESTRLWDRHIFNSLALLDLLPYGSRIADVGSGAGLPGIPIAIARPDLQLWLLEPLQRRAEFLNLVVNELKLGDRITVVRTRAEDHQGHYDLVTCRAVAPLDRLINWTSQLFLPDGLLCALKGRSAPDEISRSTKLLNKAKLIAEVRAVRAFPTAEPTNAVLVRQDCNITK